MESEILLLRHAFTPANNVRWNNQTGVREVFIYDEKCPIDRKYGVIQAEELRTYFNNKLKDKKVAIIMSPYRRVKETISIATKDFDEINFFEEKALREINQGLAFATTEEELKETIGFEADVYYDLKRKSNSPAIEYPYGESEIEVRQRVRNVSKKIHELANKKDNEGNLRYDVIVIAAHDTINKWVYYWLNNQELLKVKQFNAGVVAANGEQRGEVLFVPSTLVPLGYNVNLEEYREDMLFDSMLTNALTSDNREEVLAISKRISFMDSYKICDFAENVKLADEPENMRWLEDGIIRNKDLVHIYEFMFLMVDSGVKNFNLKRFENIIIESKNPKLMCYCIGFVPGIDFNRMLNALYETKCAKYIERLGDEEFGLDVNSLPGYHKKVEAAKKYDYFPESLSVFGTRDISRLISVAIESKNPYLINEVADYIEYLAEYKDVIGLDITSLENAQHMYADPLHLYEFAASIKSSNKIAFQNRVVDSNMPKYIYYMYEYVPGVNREALKSVISKSENKKYMNKVGISR